MKVKIAFLLCFVFLLCGCAFGEDIRTKPELFTPVPGNRLNTGKPLIKMKNRLSPKR